MVFFILSYFTGLAAIDPRARPLDSKDALQLLAEKPTGRALLSLLLLGLLGFAAWRGVQATMDPDRCGSDTRGIAKRAVQGSCAVFYLGFASIVLSMILGLRAADGDSTVRDWTAWALSRPVGRWIVGTAGLAVVATGLGIGVAGIRAEIRQYLSLRGKPRLFVTALGLVGSLTRGGVIALIGVFLIFAALDSNAHEATGFAGTLYLIKSQQHGSFLLGATAVGFLCFGLFGIVEAFFRRIDTDCLPGQTTWRRA